MTTTEKRILHTMNGRVESSVEIGGDGPPVVFLHGAGGPGWDGFLDDLAQRFTVYAPSLPGTEGDPDAVRELRGLWELVLHYYEVFDELGLSSPALIGHSFGGMVAAEVAATNPGRASRLVLISSIGLWRQEEPVRDWMGMGEEELARLVFHDPDGPVAAEFARMPEEEIARQDEQIRRSWALACSGAFVWPIPDKGLSRRIHRIAAPTLIVWGQDDGLVPPIYAVDFASMIEDSSVMMLDRAAHVPQLERRDVVSQAVVNFLSR